MATVDYEVAVKLAAQDGLSGVMRVIGGEFARLESAASHLGVILSRIFGKGAGQGGQQLEMFGTGVAGISTRMLGLGTVAAATGAAILLMAHKAGEGGAKIAAQYELMKDAMGLSIEQVERYRKLAVETPFATELQNITRIRQISPLLGEGGTSRMLETLNKAQFAINKFGPEFENKIFEFLPRLGTLGLLQPGREAELTSFLDNMVKSVQMSGGRVSLDSYFKAIQTGRVAGMGWSQRFIQEQLPGLTEEFGTGRMSVGMMLNRAFTTAQQATIQKPGGKTPTTGVAGAWAAILPGQRFTYEIGKDPDVAAKKIVDQLRLNPKIGDDMNKLTQAMNALFPGAGGLMLAMGLGRMGPQAGRAAALGLSAADVTNFENLVARQHIAWKRLWEDVDKAFFPWELAMKERFVPAFESMEKGLRAWLAVDPARGKLIADAVVALGGALLVLGGAAIITALAPLIGVGGLIAGVAVALGYLVAVDYAGLSAKLKGLADILSGAFLFGKPQTPGVGPTGPIPLPPVAPGGMPMPEAYERFVPVPGLASGDWNVSANQLAVIHKGEMVIPAHIATQMRSGGGAAPASFDSMIASQLRSGGGDQQPIRVHTTLTLDGRVLAQAVSDTVSDLYEFPTGAPSANGLISFHSPDYNIATT